MKNILSTSKMLAVMMAASISLLSCSQSQKPQTNNKNADSVSASDDSLLEQQYAHSELKTNWKKSNIPVDSVRDGGVGKNDIPAIDYPEFISVEQAHGFLTEPDFGIFLEQNGDQKFYPLSILNWHEVVNDDIDGRPVAVTFCPLCGSAMVFDRLIDGDTLLFGVSGKLYESNLLMFDEKTESLWSQALGECVVGDLTGKKLPLVNSSIISFEEIEKFYPNAKVLGVKTGFDRNYTQDPYADYLSDDNLYFPVSKKSSFYLNKDMMYVVQIGNTSVAFHWKDLVKAGHAEKNTDGGTVLVKVENYIPSATKKENGEKLNGYFSYWFSWYAMYGDKGKTWGK